MSKSETPRAASANPFRKEIDDCISSRTPERTTASTPLTRPANSLKSRSEAGIFFPLGSSTPLLKSKIHSNQGLRLLEPCGARLEEKGLYVGRTLVSVGETGPVPVKILNITDKTQTIAAQTVVVVAKPVTGEAELELVEFAAP